MDWKRPEVDRTLLKIYITGRKNEKRAIVKATRTEYTIIACSLTDRCSIRCNFQEMCDIGTLY